MHLKLSLYHKGLILLSMLLAFELIFLGSLFALLQSAELEARKYEHSMDVIKQANGLLKLYTDGAAALAFYAATHGESFKSRFQASLGEIPGKKQDLEAMLKDDPVALSDVDELGRLLDQAGSALVDYQHELDEHQGDLSELKRRAMPRIKKAMEAIKALSDKEWAEAETAYPKSGKVMRDRMVFAICLGIVLNIVFALSMLRFFSAGITRKIDLLADNSLRLASGAPLNERLRGNDELAHLDGVFHSMADVLEESNRKQQAATEAIKSSEERVRMLVDHMPVGLIAIDKEGTILSVNPRTEKIFGYEKEDLQGKNLQILFADSQGDDAKTFIQTIRQKALGKTSETSARRKNAETFPSDIAIDEIQTKDGVQLLVNVQDVTDRHEAERLKREFVAMVSHDLRTPLTSLLGSLTLLSRGALGELPGEAHEVVATAESDVERLMRLINDLLDVARIEAGKMEMNFDSTSLAAVIARSLDSVRTLADSQQIAIEVECSDVRVLADADRLVQVLVNLLSNAIKFSPPQSKIEVSVAKLPGWMEVRVRDYGRGVPEQFRKTIFERFQQVEPDDATVRKGTGLGLPICKTIIEQHGGTIGVNGDVEKGSIFWFRLQALDADAS